MPFALVIIGLILIVTGVRDTYAALGTQLQQDGPQFVKWALAIVAVGLLGYVQKLRTFSNTFMALILIAMVLAASKRGQDFFSLFTKQVNAAPKPAQQSVDVPGSQGVPSTQTPFGGYLPPPVSPGNLAPDWFKKLFNLGG